MFSKFFIERPIFATVISLIIVLAGLVSMKVLPIEQYPNIGTDGDSDFRRISGSNGRSAGRYGGGAD